MSDNQIASHWLKRAFAALVLVWFVVVTTEPAALHFCPVHGSRAAAGAPAEHHVGGHSHQQPTPSDDGSASCTCVGDCSAGGFSGAVPSREHRVVVAMPRDSDGPRMETELPRILAPAFLLPYANGPPGIRVLA